MKFTCSEHGGYVHSDGDVQIVAYDGDVMHGERAQCTMDHQHSKECAIRLLDEKPVLTPGYKDEDGKAVPAVLGLSVRERAMAWFAAYDATPEDPVHVDMPKKTVQVKNDKGKMVNKEVDDGDLA